LSLTPGTRLGPYEIVSPIGAGGMGEVYKATDTRLNRTVAIKALHDLFAHHPERVARFEREAQILASLSTSPLALKLVAGFFMVLPAVVFIVLIRRYLRAAWGPR
jgi:serine/threonine protein kinase